MILVTKKEAVPYYMLLHESSQKYLSRTLLYCQSFTCDTDRSLKTMDTYFSQLQSFNRGSFTFNEMGHVLFVAICIKRYMSFLAQETCGQIFKQRKLFNPIQYGLFF